MFHRCALLAAVALALVGAAPSRAALIQLKADLAGTNEVPPNASPAIGSFSGVLNDVANLLSFNVSFSGLTSPTTAAHIHGPAPAGVNGPVFLNFGPLGFPVGVTSGSLTAFNRPVTPAQVGWLKTGLAYVNIHTQARPGGEIRGQVEQVVPEPGTLALLGAGGLALIRRRRRAA